MSTMTISFAARDADAGINVAPPQQSVTNTTEDAFIVKKTLAANAADGTVSMWSSSLALTSFSRLIFEVDPEQELSDAKAATNPAILVLTTSGGVTLCFNVYRGCPFVLLSNIADAAAATMTATITSISVRNADADDAIDVRLTLVK